MNIVLRRLTAGDAFVLDSVAEDVFDGPIDAERLAAYLAEPSHVMMVAMAGERVIGQCAAVVHRHPDKATELYIDEIGVAPEFKRKGIAVGCSRACLRWARRWGAGRPGSARKATTSPRAASMRSKAQPLKRSQCM